MVEMFPVYMISSGAVAGSGGRVFAGRRGQAKQNTISI